MTFEKRILITGGAGFIGSHGVRHFIQKYPEYQIVNFDALTYAGNLENLKDIEDAPNYEFIHGDITDLKAVQSVFSTYSITDVVHFAAESHVDRSITDPIAFLKTNIYGTANLLLCSKDAWSGDYGQHVFYQVSTDEVYGSLGPDGLFTENTSYDPKSPYSASKASADHLVRAFSNTYHLGIKISNCSNNYGPNQFPEKLIPLVINNIKNQKNIPVYGDGSNVRDWLYVTDHVEAIDAVFHHGVRGETYNIGGRNELTNLSLVEKLCDLMDDALARPLGTSRALISFVKDRPGHDHRYAIDNQKIESELGWEPKESVESGLTKTIKWYLENQIWLDHVVSGEYQSYYQAQYH